MENIVCPRVVNTMRGNQSFNKASDCRYIELVSAIRSKSCEITVISKDGNTLEELHSKTPRLATGDWKITLFCNSYERIEGSHKDLTFDPQYLATAF